MSRDIYARGIDVSHWQQEVNWPEVRNSGILFCFTKVTQGTGFVDKRVHINWPGIKQNNILLGAYHFYTPEQNPTKQAEHFIRTVEGFSNRHGGLDLPAVLDIETRNGIPFQALVDGCKTWLDIVERHFNHRPIIYTRAFFWKDNMRVNGQFPVWSGTYPMWVAHYTSAAQPLVPAGWDNRWDFWQFTESGRVPGIRGNCDINYFNGMPDELYVWADRAMGRQPALRQGGTQPPAVEGGRTSTPTPQTQPPQNQPAPQRGGGPGELLPPGAVGRWPGDAGYTEYIYENSPLRPIINAIDFYGRPVRAKLTSPSQDLAISYKPPITRAGWYQIEIFVPEQNSHTTRALYHISTYENNQRVEKGLLVDQSLFANQWVSLGQYYIDPRRPRDGQVNATDFTDENPPRMIAFAGVRWRPV